MIKLKTILSEVYDINLLETGVEKFKIFCDLDGVLVGFDDAVKKLTGGLTFKEYVEKYGHSAMWQLINAKGSDWWANLTWSNDGKVLWEFIKPFNPTILTAGSKRNSGEIAVIGKKEWCGKNLGASIPVIVTDNSRDKQQYSKSNNILIDDLPSNINEWNAKGGIGVLHINSNDTITKLKYIFNNASL